jgi:phospholipid-binding lipoprotein MlaA
MRGRGSLLAALLVVARFGMVRAEDERPRPLPGARAGAAAPAGAESQGSFEYDPWQRVNRKIFTFNDTLDEWVLEPVAKGWDYVAPEPVERSIGNFFSNLRFPVNLVNNLLQGKGVEGAKTLGRFTVNTVLGVGGFLDPASDLGLGPENEDFGQTLGVWGVPSGPYLVLPLLGPSTVRDAPALGVDSVTAITPFFIDTFILAGARVVDVINTRARFLTEVTEAKAASLDYYAFVRSAYLQRRQAEIEDRTQPSPERTPTYDDSELYTVP